MEKFSKIQQGRKHCTLNPDRMHPSHCIQRICKKLRETGNLTTRKSERRKRVCHEDNEINILAIVNDNPQVQDR